MIRFHRIFDLSTELDQQRFAEAAALFRAAFPHEPEAIARIEACLKDRSRVAFDPIMLVATGTKGKVTGLAFVFYFPDLRHGYLQYIASDRGDPARGVGAALYEALREILIARRARGLLLDVPPVDAAKVDDPARLPTNRKRMRFYARYGVAEVKGTLWDVDANPRNEGFLTTLLYDPLGRRPLLERAIARRVVRRILVTQYGYERDDPFVERIVGSIVADPVGLELVPRPPSTAPPPRTHHLAPLKLVVAERHAIHHLKEKGYVERPVRVSTILAGLQGLPTERIPTRRFPETALTDVHHPALVHYLKAMSRVLNEKALVYPEVFPIRRPDRIPRDLEDRAGYFCADTFTPLTRNCYVAARDSANVALTGAALVAGGERLAYALCRPPGHHAERRVYGGFCYFNNSAAAAHALSRRGKVALLDIDYHHGNGAQDIFYARADVLTVSIHGHPRHAYPNFSGYADERGEGAGAGFNINFPLEPPVDDERYLAVLDKALAQIVRFAPRYLIVSLGFDIMRGDPTGAFDVSVQGMRRIGRRIGRLGLPTLVVQEGGYALRNLRTGAHAFFAGLAQTWYD